MANKINYLLLLLLISLSNCFAKNVNIPKNNVSPAEVNHLVEPLEIFSNNEAPSLEETVNEVEATLKANPDLPRLTRGEILDLLENITKTDPKYKIQKANGRKHKAVMKVLPFTPDSNTNNVEDLYTKPPLTKIVEGQGSDQIDREPNFEPTQSIQQNTVKESKTPPTENVKKYRGDQRYRYKFSTTPATITSTQSYSTKSDSSKCHGGEGARCNPNYSSRVKSQTLRRHTSTTITTTSLPPTPTSLPPTPTSRSKRPADQRRKVNNKTSPSKFSNHRYEENLQSESTISTSSTLFPTNGIKIIAPPSLPPNVINDDLLKPEGQKQQSFSEKDVLKPLVDLDVGDNDNEENDQLPFVVDVPDHLKGILEELKLQNQLKTDSKKTTSTTVKPTLKPQPIESASTSSSVPLLEFEKVAEDTLTPEMQELLMNFGLIRNTKKEPEPSESQVYFESYKPEIADVQPGSYVGFKPLPDDDNSREEMKELLARFGLDKSVRNQKSLEYKKKGGNDVQMELPKEYQEILENIGLTNKNGNPLKADSLDTTTKKHIFNPSENLFVTQEEIEKLNKLSNTVKQLENLNRPLTTEDFKKIDVETLKMLVNSLNNSFIPLDQQNAPDPLFLDNELVKNEVKRQENASESAKATESTKIESESNATSTKKVTDDTGSKKDTEPVDSGGSTDSSGAESSSKDEKVTPNIKDLEDSFGGQPEVTTETAPPIKKTGFYYLLDWNTFFDIDDQKGKRVNLRFQPKAGDPRRFYSISVP